MGDQKIKVQGCSQPQSDARTHIFYIPIHFMRVINYWHAGLYVYPLRVNTGILLLLFEKYTARLS